MAQVRGRLGYDENPQIAREEAAVHHVLQGVSAGDILGYGGGVRMALKCKWLPSLVLIAFGSLNAVDAGAQLRLSGEGQTIILNASGREVRIQSDLKLSSGEKAAFDEFQARAKYYGALSIDATGADIAFFVVDFHSLGSATAISQAACAEAAGNQGNCIVYAIVQPEAENTIAGEGQTLSESATREFLDQFLTIEKTQMYGAFSVSGLGHMAYFVLPDGIEAVRDRSLQACASFVAEAMKQLAIGAQKEAMAQDLDDCTILYLRYPTD